MTCFRFHILIYIVKIQCTGVKIQGNSRLIDDKNYFLKYNVPCVFIPIERFEGYSDEPGVCLSVCTYVHPQTFSCPLYNLKTVWNILMIFDSYVDQIMTLWHVQE